MSAVFLPHRKHTYFVAKLNSQKSADSFEVVVPFHTTDADDYIARWIKMRKHADPDQYGWIVTG
jgi:hypothetical protein